MRITILSPAIPPSSSGNAISTERIRTGLEGCGLQVQVLSADKQAESKEVLRKIHEFRPDLLHVMHAYKSGRLLGDPLPTVPILLQLTGTDLHIDLFDDSRTATVQRLLRGARVIVVSSRPEAEFLNQSLPETAPRIEVVHKGVNLGNSRFNLRGELGIPDDAFVFFLPAGIRGVKNQGIAIAALDSVKERYSSLHLVLAGPVIEADYGEQILAAVELRPWCHHIAEIPHDAMAHCYASVEVMLNTSLAEGGSNAVLEAMSMGLPVLVSDCPGNVGLVEHGRTGLTFSDQDALAAEATRLLEDPEFREKLGRQALDYTGDFHSATSEIERLRECYSRALHGSTSI